MEYTRLSENEIRTHETFVALMWALSHPGRVQSLPLSSNGRCRDAQRVIGESLLDLETSFWTMQPDLAETLARTGARQLEATQAAFLFWDSLTEIDLPNVDGAKVGTSVHPDESATLVIGCTLMSNGTTLRLQGPGIAGQYTIQVGGLPDRFWQIREERRRYPAGWDIFLIDQERLLGLPRSTEITILEKDI